MIDDSLLGRSGFVAFDHSLTGTSELGGTHVRISFSINFRD